MVEWLNQTDIEITIYLNALGQPHLNFFMLFLSKKLVWIPLYLFIIYRFVIAYPKKWWLVIAACILTIVITDQTTSTLMKPLFQRLRPCHNHELSSLITTVGNCGGKYGFASSHAANTMGLAFFVILKKELRLSTYILAWAIIVSYSRVYLGVHFFGDILVGWLVGIAAAILANWLYQKVSHRIYAYN
ncbi:MAG: phosphatase PAP2 family protein [Cyclobacteriaceae bacterium]